jgi:hypothetical protein
MDYTGLSVGETSIEIMAVSKREKLIAHPNSMAKATLFSVCVALQIFFSRRFHPFATDERACCASLH